jgi:hypothetical protein
VLVHHEGATGARLLVRLLLPQGLLPRVAEAAEHEARGRLPVNDGGYIVEIRAKGSGDGSCGSGVVVSDGSLRSSTPSDNRGRRDDGTRVLLDRDDSGAACESDISDDLGAERQGNIPQGEISDDACLFH